MSDDPFAEPSDAEKTIIRPRPSGTAAGYSGGATPGAAPRHDPFANTAPPAASGPARPLPVTGTNPLVAAASPVLAAIVRISGDAARGPDADRLKRAMVDAIRKFEVDALATGMDTRSLRAARYALCATIDDLVLNTPWGRASNWARQTMTSIFHNEVTGGERFFEILDQMQRDLGNQLPVVELMYLCMSLGFIGRYRVMPRGIAALSELREGVYRAIRMRRGDFERELSPQWRGINAGAKPLARRIPIWATALGTLAIASIAYVSFAFALSNSSEISFAELYGLPPRGTVTVPRTAPPPPAPPPVQLAVTQPSNLELKLKQFLAPEIKAGLVTVFQDAQTITVRLANVNMFGSGQATLSSSYQPLLQRIGEALNDETGQVMVNGYTDDQPIHTPRFPSNFELSQARAQAVLDVLKTKVKDPGRLHAQGKGQADPIAPNTTEDGRRQNRRTEIVLVRSSDAT
ncbi:MAG TPA: type VI secretion system protein TssL, long form [Rhodopila sp.]|uniref:type VI secretion system protein TssL, long form n=1 Tax=Rhodopila sp. TaxID=2480087 RepID=UPI002BEC1E2D|nr:type VI secretion system protein TssL, long form [Rhodopila sp.]HVY16445.1 type VI secretion system protein TssL, long form [Rhodopila sp.]